MQNLKEMVQNDQDESSSGSDQEVENSVPKIMAGTFGEPIKRP
jgi:hypothetical protein